MPEQGNSSPRGGRKALQLCAQIAEALHEALADANDDLLRDLMVLEVVPLSHLGHLLVTVGPGPAAIPRPDEEIVAHLHGAAKWLRSEAAQAIHRRKTPELTFRYVPLPS